MSGVVVFGLFLISGRSMNTAVFDSKAMWATAGSPMAMAWISLTVFGPACRPAGSATTRWFGVEPAAGATGEPEANWAVVPWVKSWVPSRARVAVALYVTAGGSMALMSGRGRGVTTSSGLRTGRPDGTASSERIRTTVARSAAVARYLS